MKIDLSNVKYHFPDGEVFPAFEADLLIGGIHAAKARNESYGAVTIIEPLGGKGRKLIEDAEADCRKTPLIFKGHEGYGEISITRTLPLHVDQLLTGHVYRDELRNPELAREREKAQRKRYAFDGQPDTDQAEKMRRDMQKGILIGEPDDYYLYEYGLSLARIIDNPDGKDILVPELMKIVRQFRGNSILNTNIPGEILKKAGLKEGKSKGNRVEPPDRKKSGKQSRGARP